MKASKFVVCFFLSWLHHTSPPIAAQGTGVRSIDTADHGPGADNGTSPSDFHYLVIGGYRPPVNDLVKYTASVRAGDSMFGANHICGGSIVSHMVILTAAHCMFTSTGRRLSARVFTVVVGTPKRLEEVSTTQEMDVRKVLPHPKYKRNALRHDLGLLLLSDELSTNDHVAIVPLNDVAPTAGLACTVVGWGTVIQFGPSPDEAVNGDLEILPNFECGKLNGFNPKGMICAKNRADSEVDSCQGDSGGPLFCNQKVTGIVSFGEGCGEKFSAGVYTDVFYYREWIIENTAPHILQMSQVSLLLALLAAWQ